MKLTNISGGRTADSTMELIVEFDGSHYEAIRFDPNTDAADVVARLHGLADRILRRAASSARKADMETRCAGGKKINPGDALGRCIDCVWSGKLGCPKVPGARADGLSPADGGTGDETRNKGGA